MLKFTSLAAAALVALSLHGTALCASPTFDRSGFDTSVRPQDDLFRAANGGWLKANAIPADKSSYGNFVILADRADGRVRAIVDELAAKTHAPGSIEQKVGSFYKSFIDVDTIDKAGTAAVTPWLARIDAVKSPRDLAVLLGEWQGRVAGPIALDVQPDAKHPDVNLALTWQAGLGLPNRDYYLSKDERKAKARAAYQAYLVELFKLNGDTAAAAEAGATAVMALETRLAQAQWDEVKNRDPKKTWNPMTLKALAASAPGFDWSAFFAASSMSKMARLSVSQPSYNKDFAKAVNDVPLTTWQLYLKAHTLDSAARVLPKAWRDARFAFRGTALAGQKEPRPRWQEGTDALDGALGEAVGQVYVARHFPPANKARMQQMVDNLMVSYGESIDKLSWMSAATRAKAREKLSKYTVKIGYPTQWRDYGKLEIRDADPLGNLMRAGRFEFERVAAKLGQPVDRTEWGMTPQTVNAYYNPSMNEIVFPAAILEPPFFDMDADDAQNYGAIGAVIGHEISHGFDDQGSQFDGDGRLLNWWTPADRKAFAKLGAALVKQYGGYEALPGQKVNGELTLGENIADLSGLEIAHKAWVLSLKGQPAPVIDGITGEQRFFYGFAYAWRGKMRDELMLRILTADPHSPDEFRANGTVVNIDSFHQAFGTRAGDRMFKPAKDRIKIW
ncbi:M13 family metallopeptidase [Ideonella margarita]|uniref:M13 family metallopeptidase n=1 Tax=Ideonella margarita TaxID=2984191 RepID=A0ABU9C4F1_9BURK